MKRTAIWILNGLADMTRRTEKQKQGAKTAAWTFLCVVRPDTGNCTLHPQRKGGAGEGGGSHEGWCVTVSYNRCPVSCVLW